MSLAPHTALSYTIPPTRRSVVTARSSRPVAASPLPLLRLDAAYLIAASLAGFAMKVFGARLSGIGFGEAHELALVAGLLLWHAAPRRCWHLSAAAVHGLLAAANVAHWQTLAAGNETTATLATGAHVVLAVLQLAAAARAR